jgi:hypothetical protein
MPARRELKHIIVPVAATAETYTPHPRGMNIQKPPPPRSRNAHGMMLKRELTKAVAEADIRRRAAGISISDVTPGLYVQFESRPDIPLTLTALEDKRQGIELVAVTHGRTDEQEPRRIERATVFVPAGKVKHFITRFESYAKTTPKTKGERRHEDMLDPVATLRLATLRGLWTDAPEVYPQAGEAIWWEIWLRRSGGREVECIQSFANHKRLELSARRLQFDDRIVMLLRATPEQLATSVDVLDTLAEVRRAKESAAFFVDDITPQEQGEWLRELLTRTHGPSDDAPAVCVLDTGVTRGHPLLSASLAASDCHACEPAWGSHDHHGHGTEMAGLALLGDITPLLVGSLPIQLRHRLESVKILPPKGDNPPELYGAITADATSRVEITAPDRRRCFSMAITATDERDRGQPTSWSAALDALAAGRSFDPTVQGLVYLDDGEDAAHRLFLVSAGNIAPESLQLEHLDRSDTDTVHDPAQAWNVLTVGAFTDKATVQHSDWNSWEPLAPAGELSPWSTTGVAFDGAWPIKPDVVFEGGNLVKNAHGNLDFPCPDVCLLSTDYQPLQKSFRLSWATSAATALAARMAASITAEYPTLWPESVRGLMVHSAEWTPRMKERLHVLNRKGDRLRLVRRYGFGVPQLERALHSAKDSLTLIAQDVIHPYEKGKLREIKFFALPWPTEALEDLGVLRVRLRVTLSYFIEPNPGRRGWKTRHRYASHGLRFDVRRATESTVEFRKRLNKLALEEDERKPPPGTDSSEWYLGEHARSRGSIHSDFLECSAADLAQRGVVAVYPLGGWWKEQPKRDRSEKGVRYTLLVSIDTPAADVDIWTPVAQEVGILVPTLV